MVLSTAVKGKAIASGKGPSITFAKKEAAVRALSTLQADGI